MNEKKKKKIENQQFDFCEVCRLNHNNGRRHNYFPKHKSSLSTLLTRFLSKLAEVKFFLKNPMLLHPEHAPQNRMWCVFCSCDVLELDRTLACGHAIEHLASDEHMKRVKEFMWKYGVEKDRVDLFRITDVEFAEWEKNCKSLKIGADKMEAVKPVAGISNNIRNDLNAAYVTSFHKNSLDSFNSNFTNDVVPLHSYTDERTQISHSVSSSASEAGTSLETMYGDIQAGYVHGSKNSTGKRDGQYSTYYFAGNSSSYGFLNNGSANSTLEDAITELKFHGLSTLTNISTTSQEATEGNVHTGAPPPWFDVAKTNRLDQQQSSHLGSSKVGKSKLNPKRVGAAWAERRKPELEMERRGEHVNNKYDANWLPNFGRVWQSSTRKESRKEFQAENKSSIGAHDEADRPVALQPYVSKRMRRDTSD